MSLLARVNTSVTTGRREFMFACRRTVWLTQKLMADLYGVSVPTVNEHLKNIYDEAELDPGATTRLDEYLVKGFVLDDERLKSTAHLGEDYFDQLLERIRDIRASERRFYQKITDIYAQCSIDYDARSKIAQTFHATVQTGYPR